MRYERQLIMEEIGREGQEKLGKSTVVVIGCGGLGSPVLTYLTLAGIGRLIIIDYDEVSESNLNRQFLHGERDIGRLKIESAKEQLHALNSEIEIIGIKEKLDEKNTGKIIQSADVVVNCVDNIQTRVLVGRECLKQDIPLVEAGVQGFYGWIMNIRPETACLECIGFENIKLKPPLPIIGVTAGVIGCLQANECIKIILGMKGTLDGIMLQYDGIDGSFDRIKLEKEPSCKGHSCKNN